MTTYIRTEKAFCGKCMEVTDCEVSRQADWIEWTCTMCGSLADSDMLDSWDDDYDHA